MFPQLPPLPSWLPEIPPVLVPYLVAFAAFFISLAAREHVYEFLEDWLNTGSILLRIVGEIVSLSDAYLKALGLYSLYPVFSFLFSLFSITISPAAFLTFSTVFIFFARHWVYPTVNRSLRTKSRLDDSFFIGDVVLRTVGCWWAVYGV